MMALIIFGKVHLQIFIYFLFNDVSSFLHYVAPNDPVDSKLKMVWKEALAVLFNVAIV
jgi:hypothetical protein